MYQFVKELIWPNGDKEEFDEDTKKSQEGSILKPLTLTGHTSSVYSVSLSTDGTLGLSGSRDKTLRLWDMKSGKCLKTLTGHTALVCSVALSSDGKLGLSGSDDKTLTLWDMQSGKCLKTLSGHTGYVWSVSLCADGKLGLSGGHGGNYDKTLRLWDIQSGKSEIFNYQTDVCSVVSHIYNHQLYALVGLEDGTVDFRHICTLPQAKSTLQPLAQALPTQPAKPGWLNP